MSVKKLIYILEDKNINPRIVFSFWKELVIVLDCLLMGVIYYKM